MDRYERTLNVVKALNSFNKGELEDYNLLSSVCEYFDFIKNEDLDDADKRFLLYLSNKAGIPHYYDILTNFNNENSLKIDDENIGLSTISSLLYESTLYTDDNSKLHQYQKEILDLFVSSNQNRFFLSASTSFGKTHLVYEVIKKIKYKNIVLIFPSIALLSENLAKIKEGKINFPIDYEIHTLSDIDNKYGEYNIFIFTPERFLSFLDKNNESLDLDFIFVDEVYKIDNGYIIDDEARENERDVAYRMSIFYGLSKFPNIDILLAGPYIEILNEKSDFYNPSFDLFLNDLGITKLLRNEYEIVKVSQTNIENVNTEITVDGINFNLKGKNTKKKKIQELLDRILIRNENAIVYCNTKAISEKVASEYERSKINTDYIEAFLNHLKNKYDNDWIVIKALEKGIGVHHGVVPKYIQKEIVSLFNNSGSGLDILCSTTTITEGVNTTAKNMIVYKSLKGLGKYAKPLVTFDAKNIAGRAGRFMEHYTGRVISLDSEFISKLNQQGEPIKHKNYDPSQIKNEIDDEMTPSQFLDDRSKERLEEVHKMQNERGIPNNIISQFKAMSKRDKIIIYDKIKLLNSEELKKIKLLIGKLNSPSLRINKEGIQIILNLCFEQVQNENLRGLIENTYFDKFDKRDYSILIVSLNSYLTKGFKGNYEYYYNRYLEEQEKKKLLKEKNGKEFTINYSLIVNKAMRDSASLIFNTFKYQLVKYLGIFNLMYKYIESQRLEITIDEVSGIDKLLIKLEYNAFSEEARIASDFGVPQNIVDYYDSANAMNRKRILDEFDSYERTVFERIKRIIEE
ncbi:DEAD/DEAH box helicase [Winogradskyella sp. 4-2091]|uniref:DEAD/DEAH box helicase n=1 Tax=Winogradskyella sp. 4-2091 TaxID=3381659 RepID=UPI003891957D